MMPIFITIKNKHLRGIYKAGITNEQASFSMATEDALAKVMCHGLSGDCTLLLPEVKFWKHSQTREGHWKAYTPILETCSYFLSICSLPGRCSKANLLVVGTSFVFTAVFTAPSWVLGPE